MIEVFRHICVFETSCSANFMATELSVGNINTIAS